MEKETLKKAKELESSIVRLKEEIKYFESFECRKSKHIRFYLYRAGGFETFSEEAIPSYYFEKFMYDPMMKYIKEKLVELEKEFDNL